MKIILEYNDKTYESAETDDEKAGEIFETFYDNFSNIDRFKMILKDGSLLIIGKAAIQSAVLIFVP